MNRAPGLRTVFARGKRAIIVQRCWADFVLPNAPE
jgi:hypothetical protein